MTGLGSLTDTSLLPSCGRWQPCVGLSVSFLVKRCRQIGHRLVFLFLVASVLGIWPSPRSPQEKSANRTPVVPPDPNLRSSNPDPRPRFSAQSPSPTPWAESSVCLDLAQDTPRWLTSYLMTLLLPPKFKLFFSFLLRFPLGLFQERYRILSPPSLTTRSALICISCA